MDVIIFGGQSNMQGQAEKRLWDTPVQNAWEYKYLQDTAVPLADPAGENITYELTAGNAIHDDSEIADWLKRHVLGAACYDRATLVPAFCDTYVKETGREVLAVHAAKGSTQVHDWLPGTPGFDALVAKSRGALRYAAGHGGVGHVDFVWLQGESDAIFQVTETQYAERIRLLCAALREALGIEHFGIIRVGRFTKDERDLQIMGAQERVCREDEAFVMLTDIAEQLNSDPEAMNPNIGGHFGAVGLERLGKAAGAALAALRK